MNNNLDIFICTNKDFEIYPNNNSYKIVTTEDFETKTTLEVIKCDINKDDIILKEHGYSEGARFHYVWKNCELKDYVGTAHYRRYFEFFDEIPDMDEIFKSHDAILPGNFDLGWPSIYVHYSAIHHKEDLVDCLKIIARKYPEYFQTAIDSVMSPKLIPCNVFILRKEMFIKWCEFVFGVLEEFDKMHCFKTDKDIENYVIKNNYAIGKSGMVADNHYQARIQAFLMERLSTIFFNYRVKNPYYENMILTEYHEEWEKSWYNYKDLSNKK